MFTHKPVRNGSDISITIFGENGERFARRIAENAVEEGERLGAVHEVTPDGDRQKFLFHVEQVAPAASPSRAVAPRKARRRPLLFRPTPQQRGMGTRPELGLGPGQLF